MADDVWSVVSSLAEPQRRGLYTYVRSEHRPVTRDEAATACGISRSLAAFHLDKLVEAGLLTATTGQFDGDAAPRGRGRPPKAYRASDAEIRVIVPEQHLDLLGDILLEAVVAPDATWPTALAVARRHGEQHGRAHRLRHSRGRRGLTALTKALDALGSEPRADGTGRILLANCPFRPLAQCRPELVCQIYRAFCEGVIAGFGIGSTQAWAEPSPRRCCVVIQC